MTPPVIDLAGRVALVTGGGAGIGQGCAVSLASAGADVVIADIDLDRAEHTAKLVREHGRQALPVRTDVMDTDQVRAGVTGRLFLDQSERSWRRHIDINLVSMLAATSAAVPLMIRGGRGGSIVN